MQLISTQMHLNDCNKWKQEQIQTSIRMQALETQNIYLRKENMNQLVSIKSLKRANSNMYDKYMNLKIAYELKTKSNKLNQIEKKYLIQNMQEAFQIHGVRKISLMYYIYFSYYYNAKYSDKILSSKNTISQLIQKEVNSAQKIEGLMKNVDFMRAVLKNTKLRGQNMNDLLMPKLQNQIMLL